MALLYYCKAAVAMLRNLMRLVNESCIWCFGTDRRQRPSLMVAMTGCLLVLSMLTNCDVERRKSDSELGLNPQQAAGRRVYDAECARCHEPYSTRGKKGPGLKGVFKHQYLSLSGLPANDERASDIIRLGRNEMPGYSQKLSQEDIQNLLAYMHTL